MGYKSLCRQGFFCILQHFLNCRFCRVSLQDHSWTAKILWYKKMFILAAEIIHYVAFVLIASNNNLVTIFKPKMSADFK